MMRLLTPFFNLRRPRGLGSWRGPSRRTRRRGSGRRRSCRSSRTLQRTGGEMDLRYSIRDGWIQTFILGGFKFDGLMTTNWV